MATGFCVTPTAAQGMLNSTGLAEAVGASPHIHIYSGTVPALASTALGAQVQLAELVCASTPFSGFTDTGTAGRATFGAIANDSSADATGTASFFRLTNSAGTTTIAQGTCGTSAADLILNTVSITAASAVSITSGTIDFPYGP
jgi:hypothetical protein